MPKCCVDYLNPINPPTMHHEIVNPADFGRVHLGQLAPAPPPKKKKKRKKKGRKGAYLTNSLRILPLNCPTHLHRLLQQRLLNNEIRLRLDMQHVAEFDFLACEEVQVWRAVCFEVPGYHAC